MQPLLGTIYIVKRERQYVVVVCLDLLMSFILCSVQFLEIKGDFLHYCCSTVEVPIKKILLLRDVLYVPLPIVGHNFR